MFRKFIFIGILSLFLFSSISVAQAREEISFIRVKPERGWFGSFDFLYRSHLTEIVKMRTFQQSLTCGYILDKNWSIMVDLPIEQHLVYRKEEGKKETLYALGNMTVGPRYMFTHEGKSIQLSLNMKLPTLNKIGGTVPYDETEEKMQFFGIAPQIAIGRVYDPIITTVMLSFSQPLWRERERDGVYSLWNIQLGSDFHFIINKKFSLHSSLGIVSQKVRENYLFKVGVAYNPKPYQEWKIYLLNDYDGLMWSSSIGVSFSFFREDF